MIITFQEAYEVYKHLKLGSIPKAHTTKSEQYFSAISLILEDKGIEILPEPTEKVR